MVSLDCPLCCNETFQTPASLKCHLLRILDNLICPLCHEKFDKLTELADHLETDCTRSLSKSEDENYRGSLLAKALLATPKAPQNVEAEEAQYYCQMCNLHFDDIEGHLKEFHEGEEIVVEEENDEMEITENQIEGNTVYIIDPVLQSEEEEDTENTETETQVSEIKIDPNKLKTISQQDIKDKDGRLYTRKFVKIDKFWLQNDKMPVLQKYVDQDTKRINTQIKNQLIGKGSILTMNKCSNCNMYFADDELYKTHKCAEVEKIKCEHCSSTFDNAESFNEHNKVHLNKDNVTKKAQVGPFNCEVCNTVFPTFKSLRLHRRMHEPIKSREIEAPSKFGLYENDIGEEQERQMFVCKICKKTYDKQYESIHMNMHSSSNGFNCEICNRKFFTQANLDMHMKAHSNNKKFTCSYCKKPFVTYDALNEHLLNQCQKRPYACQFCGRRFARPHEKVKHERIHTGEKPHVCDICGKAFRVSYCLTLHLRTHSGTRPYQCKDCGKRFKSHSVYNHHLLTHSDVRAYKCPYCPKAFKTSVQLAGHKNSHIKPFTCTECNRPFASLYAVRAHMETHKRDNNLKYECWMCGALYSRAFALRDHLKQQHQQGDGVKAKAVALSVEEEMEATNSILVSEDDIILGLDGANIEIIENEAE